MKFRMLENARRIRSNRDLVKLLCKNSFSVDSVTFRPLKRAMLNFITEGNQYALEETDYDMHLSKNNVQWQWVMDDVDYIMLQPSPVNEDDLDEDYIDAFNYAFEGVWNESEAGDRVVLSGDEGLSGGGPDWSFPDINPVENTVEENIEAIKKHNLYSIFGLTEKDFE